MTNEDILDPWSQACNAIFKKNCCTFSSFLVDKRCFQGTINTYGCVYHATVGRDVIDFVRANRTEM